MVVYTVYSSPGCGYCTMAYRLLENRKLNYISIDITEDEDALALFREEGYKTVPQIYCNGVHIGGFTELNELLQQEGEIRPSTYEGSS
jgi:glutaredoxin